MNEGCELVRVALRKHIYPVSKAISLCIKQLKKSYSGLRIVVSYADSNEGHNGGIYQAGNWIYSGMTKGCNFYLDKKGKIWHPRNVSEDLWRNGKQVRPKDCIKIWKKGKHRYLYPLDKKMRKQIESLKKEYPKRATSIDSDAPAVQVGEGGASPTVALKDKRIA
jgi:hypothetical protein